MTFNNNPDYHFFSDEDKTSLSNFSEHSFEASEINFKSSEHAFMFTKAISFGDIEQADKILETDSPIVAKHLGREVIDYDDDVWVKHRVAVMYDVLTYKFTQNEDARAELLATYPKQIVSTNDSVWGIGLDKHDPKVSDPANWNGENLLGECLTKVRDSLMKEA